MSLWVIIPVKPLRRSKSRLSDVLNEDERTLLNYHMLENTLSILKEIQSIDGVLVVSRDPSALTLARTYDAKTLQEDGEPGLNLALKRAVVVAKAYSANSIMILPADLPLITCKEIKSVIDKLDVNNKMIISPDRRMSGTNMLIVSPVDLVEFSFGPGSFERHVRQAQSKGAHIDVHQLESIGLDIDLPEDLDLYLKMQVFHSKEFLNIGHQRGD
ncbi:MAG: 2-phospho-L-lactate guanylyltransferase [Chloroflexi bacterium HGW-Chloroflexi-8]|nr:MAG: 2-phospho-L-lactate guanylyltransferase [Chloroflexi bacterium HGW-Chloroflexi-8]